MITFTLNFTPLQTSVGGVVGEGVGGGGHVGVALHQRGHGQPQRLGQEQGGNVGQPRLHTPRVSRVSRVTRVSCPPEPHLVADVDPQLRVVVLPGRGLEPQRALGDEGVQIGVRDELVTELLLRLGAVHVLHRLIALLQLHVK